MVLNGSFIKSYWKNEKSGISSFSIKNNNETILCKGISLSLSYLTPLSLEGDFNKDNVFEFSKIQLCGYDEDSMIKYLRTKEFDHVGTVAATKLVSETGSDLFSFVRRYNTAEEALTKLSYNTPVVLSILTKLKEKTDFEELLNYVVAIGGSYHNIVKLRKGLGSNTLNAIRKNPYLMLYSDVPIEIVEKEAAKKNVPSYDNNRISAIVMHALERNESNGNTRMTFHELLCYIHQIEEKTGYKTNNIYIAAELTKHEYTVKEEDNDYYVYITETYIAEKEIGENVASLQKSSIPYSYDSSYINKVEKALNIAYSEEQRLAFDVLKDSGIKIITGGPGTGKTTFLNGLIQVVRAINPYMSIALCAPTGCAAARMSDSTGEKATTIHKLLGIGPQKFYKKEKLDADVLIVDEVSMIGTKIFNLLLTSVKNGSLVILLGDKNQLPSIDAGNVLADMINSEIVPVYSFNKIFRQKDGNSIIDNAYSVINGNTNLITDKNFTIRRYDNTEALVKALKKSCEHTNAEYTCFTATRKTKYSTGSIMLNRLIGSTKKQDKESVEYGYYSFHVGDKIILNRNNYEKGYYNGEVGIITNIQQHNDNIKVSISADGDMLYLENAELNDIELGYVLTAHKAQGSECENAVIVVTKKPYNMLQKELLYVEITRAKKNVLIMTEDNALEKCILSNHKKPRCTGLKKHLIPISA